MPRTHKVEKLRLIVVHMIFITRPQIRLPDEVGEGTVAVDIAYKDGDDFSSRVVSLVHTAKGELRPEGGTKGRTVREETCLHIVGEVAHSFRYLDGRVEAVTFEEGDSAEPRFPRGLHHMLRGGGTVGEGKGAVCMQLGI